MVDLHQAEVVYLLIFHELQGTNYYRSVQTTVIQNTFKQKPFYIKTTLDTQPQANKQMRSLAWKQDAALNCLLSSCVYSLTMGFLPIAS